MHPFFVSLVEINHNAKEADLEISVRIFTEDFEKTLQKYSTAKIDVLNPPNPGFLDSQIGAYIGQKLKLRINGRPVTLKYLGHEVQKESVWAYLEVPGTKSLNKLEVECSLLYDFEASQSNVLHVKAGAFEKSTKLDNPHTTAAFDVH